MPPIDRAYTYQVAAELTITGQASLSAAQTAAATALTTLRTSLAALSENVELSFPETGGLVALSATGNGAYGVNGALVVGTDERESAQSVAKDAAANIASNIPGGAAVTLDHENGEYVLEDIG